MWIPVPAKTGWMRIDFSCMKRLIVLLLVIMVGVLIWVLQSEQGVSRFHLYYGSAEPELKQLENSIVKGSLLVVDYRAFDQAELRDWIEKRQNEKAKVLAYISIGEIHSREVAALKQMLPGKSDTEIDDLLLDRNEVFDSYRVDVSNKTWTEWIEVKLHKIYALGFDGVFLDTVDTVDLYASKKEWKLDRRAQSAAAMIELIGHIKHFNLNKYVLQNGGLNMIGEKMFVGDAKGIMVPGQNLANYQPNNPDGILWENAYAGDDDWTMGNLKKLIAIKASKKTDVFALGYQHAHASPEALAEQCKKHDFIGAWAVSTEVLHEAATKVVKR